VVKFDWTDNSTVGPAQAGDKVMTVVYCPAMQQAIFTIGEALRGEETLEVDCSQFAGKVVHTYIACMAADGRNVAASAYTGQLTVS
jgi:hypothetical protein